jgi:UDP-N-acetylmuramoyl-L-alanyl-D-glutamate--2,6-diaminopimelate ligase
MMRPFGPSTLNLQKVAGAVSASCELSEQQLSQIEISGVTHNDSQVEPGDLFIAIQGAHKHGADFAEQAIKNGAVAVLTDAKGAAAITGVPVLVVADPRRVAGHVAALLYNEPMRDLASIGITGTNGKTTVSTLIYQIFEAADRACGLIGTIETRIGKDFAESARTTPEATDLQAISAVMRERHMRHLVMEVSSHAMVLHRMQGAHFAFVGFTNLSQDHLDFHGDIESYFAAKAKLFTYDFADQAVINIDSQYGARLATSTQIPVISLSRHNSSATWHFAEIDASGKQVQFKIRGSGGILIESSTKLRGGYNLDNLLMAVAIAVESGVDPIDVAAALPSLSGAAGRLEEINVGQNFSALVDYAHTPDAVTNALESIREFTNGKVIAVLGCGGDRDATKRPLMGQALIQGCDIAIFTSDNPRSENPSEILKEMVGVTKVSEPNRVIEDRKSAIEYAVSLAKEGDTVAILGKGHELGQEINGKKLDFDDRKVLAQAIAGIR